MVFYQPTIPATNPPVNYMNPPMNGGYPAYGQQASNSYNQPPIPNSTTTAITSQPLFNYGQQQQQSPPQFMNPVAATAPIANPVQNLSERSQTPIVEKVVKGPLPDEHLIIQTVFDTLIRKCSEVASNAAVKRKVDDAAKKIEILYDKLRDRSVIFSI